MKYILVERSFHKTALLLSFRATEKFIFRLFSLFLIQKRVVYCSY